MAAPYHLTVAPDACSTPDASAAVDFVPASRVPASTPGFAVRLPRAQLADLIQINCLNRIRGVFRVRSSHGDGFLFFDAGQLVHASCSGDVGLDAVVAMLGWRSGSIEPSEHEWPAQSSIGMGADALLLHAAQRQDEQAREASGYPTCVETRRGSSEQQRVSPSSPHDATTKVVRRVAHPDDARGGASPRAEESGVALASPFGYAGLSRLEITRVASDGHIERLKPGASTELADTAFFCQRLATLVGEGLGLGPCRALACESVHEGLVVFQGRSIVGARGALADLEFVLAKVGLE